MSYSNRIITQAVYILLILLTIGCSKNDGISSKEDRLKNSWKLVKVATDDNKNQVIDNDEIKAVDSGYLSITKYNNDKTGYEKVTANKLETSYYFNWVIYNDTVAQYRIGRDTAIYKISYISDNELQLTTTTSWGLSSYFYKKQ